jgi:hypothetical protein
MALQNRASPLMYDATSFEEMDQLKDRLEATLASADDLRRGLAFSIGMRRAVVDQRCLVDRSR